MGVIVARTCTVCGWVIVNCVSRSVSQCVSHTVCVVLCCVALCCVVVLCYCVVLEATRRGRLLQLSISHQGWSTVRANASQSHDETRTTQASLDLRREGG